MTPLDSLLRSSFEDWAKGQWFGHGLASYNEFSGEYTDDETHAAWESYKEATRKLLESLVLGVEATREGAAVCLMAKLGGVAYVVQSQYVVADKPVIGRVG